MITRQLYRKHESNFGLKYEVKSNFKSLASSCASGSLLGLYHVTKTVSGNKTIILDYCRVNDDDHQLRLISE